MAAGASRKAGPIVGVVEEGEDEAAEVRVGEGGDVAAELGGHRGDVVLGGGDEVGGVDLGGGGEAHLGEGDLELALVLRDLALDLDVAAAAQVGAASAKSSHMRASNWPVLSARVRARYWPPLPFLSRAVMEAMAKKLVMGWFSKRGASAMKKSFMGWARIRQGVGWLL